MRSVRLAFLASLGLSWVCLAAAFYSKGGWVQILAGLAVGISWAILGWKGRRLYSFGFLGLLALVVYGAVASLPAAWLLGSLVCLLAAWDLGEFCANLVEFSRAQASSLLVHNHLQRTFWVAGAGFLLGAGALLVKIRLGFEVAVLLGLLVFVGIAGAVRFLRDSL